MLLLGLKKYLTPRGVPIDWYIEFDSQSLVLFGLLGRIGGTGGVETGLASELRNESPAISGPPSNRPLSSVIRIGKGCFGSDPSPRP
jgi:hypothetical protein